MRRREDGEGGRREDKEEKEDAVDRTCRLCHADVAVPAQRGPFFYAPTARAARCFTVEQKGGGVGGGERAHRRKRRRGPREARGHSRLCKPYRSAHYLAARAVYLIILWCNASARARDP